MNDDDTIRTAAILAHGPFKWVESVDAQNPKAKIFGIEHELWQGDALVGLANQERDGRWYFRVQERGFNGLWYDYRPDGASDDLDAAKRACEAMVLARMA
jgi:hypothetical protein